MSETRPAPGEFVLIQKRDTGLRLIREGAKNQTHVKIWISSASQIVNATLVQFNYRDQTITLSIPDAPDLDLFMRETRGIRKQLCHFSLLVSNSNVFFRSQFVERTENGELVFQFPEKVFKIQNRRHPRLEFTNSAPLYVELADPVNVRARIKRMALDISREGMALLMSHGEEGRVRAGQLLEGFQFKIKNKPITVDGTVQYIHVIAPDSSSTVTGVKMGVWFRNIEPELADWIGEFVDNELRKYFTSLFQSVEPFSTGNASQVKP